jgi:hypothetical protein
VRKLLPAVLSGAMAVSFSTLAFAQGTATTETTKERKDNVHYNIHQRGDQASSQIGSDNQSSQISGSGNQVNQQSGEQNAATQTQQQGSDNTATTTTQGGTGNTAATTTQQGTQNQSAVGTGNQQSQQAGTGHQSSQDSTWSQANAQNRQSGDPSASADDDDKRGQKGRHANKGWHKGWDNPASSGSTRY